MRQSLQSSSQNSNQNYNTATSTTASTNSNRNGNNIKTRRLKREGYKERTNNNGLVLKSETKLSKVRLCMSPKHIDQNKKATLLQRKMRKSFQERNNDSNLNSNTNGIFGERRMKMKSSRNSSQHESVDPVVMREILRTTRKRSSTCQTHHGWSWVGQSVRKPIFISADKPPQIRRCYSAIRHIEGDVIKVRDCVLIRSGPRKTDLPFVAKICELWEAPENADMMMSLLWYYRPEHIDLERCPNYLPDEVFASKHRDVDTVACIEDKCYVLSYNEYCRYRKRQIMLKQGVPQSVTELIIPGSDRVSYINSLPVYLCFRVYDFRKKRLLKNPF